MQTLPALLHTLADLTQPRVATHAGAALVNFSEECPKHILEPYLQTTMDTIVHVLQETYQKVQQPFIFMNKKENIFAIDFS